SRGRDPLRSKDYSQQTSDELRLLGGSQRPDPNGVRIVPGQSLNKKRIADAAPSFRPMDTISRKSRDSGPVRVRGKERQFFGRLTRPSNTADSPERAPKRRRVEDPLDDRGAHQRPAASSVVIGHSTRVSPIPSQISPQAMRQKDFKAGQPSEYRSVENGIKVPRISPQKMPRRPSCQSSEDRDLGFIHGAVQERRRQSIVSSVNSEPAARDQLGALSVPSVEISNKSTTVPTKKTAKGPPAGDYRALANGKMRASLSRESPDELQGEATVRPVPASLEDSTKNAPSAPRTSSPSNIRPTVFTSSSHGTLTNPKYKKAKAAKGKSVRQSFKVTFFRGGAAHDPPESQTDELVVNSTEGDICIRPSEADIRHEIHIPLQKVLKILTGDTASRKIRLETSKGSEQETKFDIELSSVREKEEFCSLARELHIIEVQEKPCEWMDKAFKRRQREGRQQEGAIGVKRSWRVTAIEETPELKPEASRRVKLSDALQNNEGNVAGENPDTTPGNHILPSAPTVTPSEKSNSRTTSGPVTQRNEAVEIPVKKYNPIPQTSVRATRSMARQLPTTVLYDDDPDSEDDGIPQLGFALGSQKWAKHPLVYPRYGKKKAEVGASDLERLGDREFLNDNLIGFYIRFLEDHLERCNPEAAKRVYFFNSYFFATLTNLPRGKRGINYAGVQKWTRSVDLFSYDYIVVPINENAHWYVAIICNLPYLPGILDDNPAGAATRSTSEVKETPEPSGPTEPAEGPHSDTNAEPAKEETTRQSLASMSLLDKPGAQETPKHTDTEWPEQEENPNLPPTKFFESSSQTQPESDKPSESKGSPRKGRKPKKKYAGIRYPTSQPIIITFDSLDVARSPTITILREYLFEEAKSKRGVEIDKTLVKGMTARGIPLQPNYSDCGLYLLAYVEKFVQDPDLFIRKLLQKEMSSESDWPPLRSGLLRYRLRKFLEALYIEQEQLSREKADEKGCMVDLQPISYLLGMMSSQAAAKPQSQSQSQVSPVPESNLLRSPSSARPCVQSPTSPRARSASHPSISAHAKAGTPVINIDQVASTGTESTKPLKAPSARHEIIEVPDSQDQAKPSRLTQSVETRSTVLATEPKQKGGDTGYVEDSDGVEEVIVSNPQNASKGKKIAVHIQVPGTPPQSPKAA
ncbi:hypothetical protein ARAM_000827, partial [Aspergillus rambellii]